MNKLTDVQKRLIVLGIGVLIILAGLVQAIFKLDIFVKYKKVIDEGTFVLMIIAFALLFSKSKPKPAAEAQNQVTEQVKVEEKSDVDQTKTLQ
jgi:hypothetical protein